MTGQIKANDIPAYAKALMDAGGDLYEVGGPVRDRLLGRMNKDHDLLCRHLTVNQILAIIKPFGKALTVGSSFGVIKFFPHSMPNLTIDITLPRLEHSTGVGHRDFDVHFDPELQVEEDLGRRDFTINAMAMSFTDGKLIDPYGGRSDLETKILRQVFPKAFEEDPLRLVRAVQFAARFGLKIEPSTWDSMLKNAHLIKTVSGERISQELVKLMNAPKPSTGFDLMEQSGLLGYILPEIAALKGIEQDKQPGEDVYDHTMRALDAGRSDPEMEHQGDPELLFAILLHDVGKARTSRYNPEAKRIVFFGHQIVSSRLARKWMERMKFSSTGLNPARITRLIENHMFETKAHYTDRAIRRFVAKVGPDLIFWLLDMRFADNRGGKHPHGIKGVLRLRTRIRAEMAKKPPFGPKDLLVNGHDIMTLGVPEGPAVGRIIASLVEKVLDDPTLNNKEQLLALTREMMGYSGSDS